MWRGLISIVSAACLATLAHGDLRASGSASPLVTAPILERFFASDDPAPTAYGALRHLEAHNEHFHASATMDVWTEADRSGGFQYRIVRESGSEYIRNHVFRAVLKLEREMWEKGAEPRGAVTRDNYRFEHDNALADGLVSVAVTPRRKDILLVSGSIFLQPEDGELVRLEGCLSKAPSFWVRHVDIVRHYRRLAGVTMPVAMESTANVMIAGRSTFRMTYEYETVNGQRIASE